MRFIILLLLTVYVTAFCNGVAQARPATAGKAWKACQDHVVQALPWGWTAQVPAHSVKYTTDGVLYMTAYCVYLNDAPHATVKFRIRCTYTNGTQYHLQ